MRTCRLVLLCAVLAAAVNAETFEARVISILRGDVIEVMRDNKPAQVMLYGVDSPELDQPFGPESVEFLASLTFNKPVKVTVRGKHPSGRLVGVVALSKTSVVNEAVLAEGMAWWSRSVAGRESRYQQLEKQARAAGKGLWSGDESIAPWDWREGKRSALAEAK